jgi:uncharacterized protein YggT (Ycf19 family)
LTVKNSQWPTDICHEKNVEVTKMTLYPPEDHTREVEEEIVQDPNPVRPVERHERTEAVHSDHGEYRERVVTDLAAERRTQLSKFTQLLWLLLIMLEILIATRIFLKVLGGNASNAFADMVYTISDIFLWPFQGLLGTPSFGNSVLELSSIVGMIVYAVAGWALIKLLYLIFAPTKSRRVSVYEREHQ